MLHATRMQDTVTGFLLAGIGQNEANKSSNYFVVDPSMSSCIYSAGDWYAVVYVLSSTLTDFGFGFTRVCPSRKHKRFRY